MTRDSKSAPAIVAIATYVIVSGFVTQSGVILGPAAAYFGSPVADTALLFSYLYGGNLGGILVSLFVFAALSIRQVLLAAYGALFAGVALMAATHDLHVAFAAAALIGFGAGTGLSTGAVIIAKLFTDRRRAIAFLATDCAFSGAGYVFPSLVGFVLAAGWPWQSGYVLVSIVPAFVMIASAFIRFPVAAHGEASTRAVLQDGNGAAYLRASLFAAALPLYLTGQTIFTIWSPSILQSTFGLTPLRAGAVVGTFFGASSFGLISAAMLVTRIAPRLLLCVSMTLALIFTLWLVLAPNAALFFGLTTAFGFCSTCMFKLMISIGSEQIPSSPPQLVTFLLFCASLGGILAPAASGPVVKAFGVHATLLLSVAVYSAAFICVTAALLIERTRRGERFGDAELNAAPGAR